MSLHRLDYHTRIEGLHNATSRTNCERMPFGQTTKNMKLSLRWDLGACAQADDISFFVGDSRSRINTIVGRLAHPSTRSQAIKDLQVVREELASITRLWTSAQVLTRIDLTSNGVSRQARKTLGVWLAELPAVAFPNVSNTVCKSLGIDASVRSKAVAAHQQLRRPRATSRVRAVAA